LIDFAGAAFFAPFPRVGLRRSPLLFPAISDPVLMMRGSRRSRSDRLETAEY
jgi:hypothetical protein